ncbi:putative prophage protein, partial [Streptococcus pneumoniae]
MGFLNLFKRDAPDVGFDFEELERMLGRLQLKSLAIDKSAEFVARIFAKSEFRYMVENHHVTSDWDYILNVRPNKNESASEFWQKVIYRLLTKNEVLIVLSDDKQLLVADAFTRRRYA